MLRLTTEFFIAARIIGYRISSQQHLNIVLYATANFLYLLLFQYRAWDVWLADHLPG